MGFMTPLLVFVLAFVACCGVIACVFLARPSSVMKRRGSAGIALCRSAAEEFRAGEIPKNGEIAYFQKDMTSCAEADAYYYINTEVTAAETETGALYAGKITAYTAEQDKEIYALNVRCYQPKGGNAMSRNRFRIGSIAVLFAVVVLCVAIFGVLTVSSAVSDRRAAERYGEHVEVLYACENAGQDWLSEADAYLKGAGDLPGKHRRD